MKKREIHVVYEFGKVVALDAPNERVPNGCKAIPPHDFNALKDFVTRTSQRGDRNVLVGDDDVLEVMRAGFGKIGEKKRDFLQARNYVGVIAFKDGHVLEILPKACPSENNELEHDEEMARRLLLRMLRTLADSPCKSIQLANLKTDRMPVLEVFIRMFVDEVSLLAKRGLKRRYETVEDNARFMKGKLLFATHIKHNFIHQERFFIAYDEFNANNPENRILKATLKLLERLTSSGRTKNDIRRLLGEMEDIADSATPLNEFEKCQTGRIAATYARALEWSKVFLSHLSFTSYSGSTIALALLYPMEKLFESYVAYHMRIALGEKYEVKAQERKYHLLYDEHAQKNIFQLKPDIVLRDRENGVKVIICDTKWKLLLDDSRKNYGISQADMYQMYAYYHKYKCCEGLKDVRVYLLYPEAGAYDCALDFIDKKGSESALKMINVRQLPLSRGDKVLRESLCKQLGEDRK